MYLLNAIEPKFNCQRPYHAGNTGTRLITEVKQRRALLVLAWVTGWESEVLLTFFLFKYWADPRSNAIRGQPLERAEQAPAFSPSSKNFDNLIAFQWKAIQRLT